MSWSFPVEIEIRSKEECPCGITGSGEVLVAELRNHPEERDPPFTTCRALTSGGGEGEGKPDGCW